MINVSDYMAAWRRQADWTMRYIQRFYIEISDVKRRYLTNINDTGLLFKCFTEMTPPTSRWRGRRGVQRAGSRRLELSTSFSRGVLQEGGLLAPGGKGAKPKGVKIILSLSDSGV